MTSPWQIGRTSWSSRCGSELVATDEILPGQEIEMIAGYRNVERREIGRRQRQQHGKGGHKQANGEVPVRLHSLSSSVT